MVDDMSAEQLETRVTRLEANFAGMAESLRRIEGMLSDVVAVAKQLASLEQSHGSHTRGLERAFSEIERLKLQRENDNKDIARLMAEHIKDDDKRHEEIELGVKDCEMKIGVVQGEVKEKSAWAQGALASARMWWAASGAVIMGVLGWTALKVMSMSEAIALLQQKVGG